MKAGVKAALLWAALAVVSVAGPVLAGTVGDARRLGDVAARPEDLIVFSDSIRMGARVVFDKDEALAAEVTQPALLRLELGFMTDKAAGDQPVRLHCRVTFVSPEGTRGKPVMDKVCYKGNLSETAGKWTLIPMDFRFRPQVTDTNGASGVEVLVTEEIAGTVQVLMPTYGWQGGRE